MGFTQSDAIEVKQIKGKGRGVFARRLIYDGEVIERVPVLVLPVGESRGASGPTPMSDYCFDWGRGMVAVALGYGSLYNHSYQPNARYDDCSGQTKIFMAIRDIAPGEEIVVNYNGEPGGPVAVWFKVQETEPSPKEPDAMAHSPAAATKPTPESHMGISCERRICQRNQRTSARKKRPVSSDTTTARTLRENVGERISLTLRKIVNR
jgi:uncharacterized protein